MSLLRHPIAIGNPEGTRFEPLQALVDTGGTFTMVPASVLRALGVPATETTRFRLADGRAIEREIGETQVQIEGRTVRTVVVFGDEGVEPLLGAYTLERALLAVDPTGQRLVPTDALLMCLRS